MLFSINMALYYILPVRLYGISILQNMLKFMNEILSEQKDTAKGIINQHG